MLLQKSICCAVVGLIGFGNSLAAGEPKLVHAPLSAELVAVPQNLLGLSHTPEVQQNLKLDAEQLAQLEKTLREIDKVWWPSRNLPVDKQRSIVAELETKMVTGLQRIKGQDAVNRLRQIELQSQSARVLLRPEVAKLLQLDESQNKKLVALFEETDKLGKDISPNDETKAQQFATAKQIEPKKAIAILQPAQLEQLRIALGEPLDTTKVERIYPFAPELVESRYWTTEKPVKLSSMRGKVVLVHFYAFQCHNCVANFGHYKRWDETLKRKGVEVIGIQTPETQSEREPDQVIGAAKKEGFKFPVLIDIESKNWNAWGNTMWPTVYVLDKKGYIRFWWQGELNWQGATTDKKIEAVIDQLLKEDA